MKFKLFATTLCLPHYFLVDWHNSLIVRLLGHETERLSIPFGETYGLRVWIPGRGIGLLQLPSVVRGTLKRMHFGFMSDTRDVDVSRSECARRVRGLGLNRTVGKTQDGVACRTIMGTECGRIWE